MLRSYRHHIGQTDLVTVDPGLLFHCELPVDGSFIDLFAHGFRIVLRAVDALEGVSLSFGNGCASLDHRMVLTIVLDQLSPLICLVGVV